MYLTRIEEINVVQGSLGTGPNWPKAGPVSGVLKNMVVQNRSCGFNVALRSIREFGVTSPSFILLSDISPAALRRPLAPSIARTCLELGLAQKKRFGDVAKETSNDFFQRQH